MAAPSQPPPPMAAQDSHLARYHFDAAAPHTTAYLSGPVVDICRRLQARRVLDFGCGNGAMCGVLVEAGFEIVGCDPSTDGIQHARAAHPSVTFHQLGADDDAAPLGERFDVVVSTEVIEHMFEPRSLPHFAAKVLKPGGHIIISTPYHGYLKNLALALMGAMDRHYTALWPNGHIKFWSRNTLTRLLESSGFHVTAFEGAGRIPYLWKSMILTARKPTDDRPLTDTTKRE